MSSEELKKKISIAKKAVEDESEPYKLEAFKIILTSLMRENFTDAPLLPAGSPTTPAGKQSSNDPQFGVQELAKNCNISLEELNNIISIKDHEIELLLTAKSFGDTETKQRVNASQVILIAYHIIFKTEWVKSTTLAPCLKKIGILDPHGNLATQLKTQTDIFRKSPSVNEYKLTTPQGRNSACEIIKKLAKGEKLEN